MAIEGCSERRAISSCAAPAASQQTYCKLKLAVCLPRYIVCRSLQLLSILYTSEVFLRDVLSIVNTIEVSLRA